RRRAAHLHDTAVIDRDTDAAGIRAIEGADAGALFKRHGKTPRRLANELRIYPRNRPRRQIHAISSARTSSAPLSWKAINQGAAQSTATGKSRNSSLI